MTKPICFPASAVLAAAAMLTGCAAKPQAEATSDTPPETSASASVTAFEAIRPDEAISLVGTEPFWGGKIVSGTLTYTTPENPKGTPITLRRFDGMGGIGFSGTLEGKPFDLAISAAKCSDGMSDRSFPFSATLRIGTEQRQGCAFTQRSPFSETQ